MDAATARRLFEERDPKPPKGFNELVQRAIAKGKRQFLISMTQTEARAVEKLGYAVEPHIEADKWFVGF